MATRRQRSTDDEIGEREDYALDLVSRLRLKSEIKRDFCQRYKVSVRTAEDFISRARARMRVEYAEKSAEGLEVIRCDSYQFYLSVIRDPLAQISDKLRAQERIDKLFGIERPLKVAQTTADGKDYESMSSAELDAKILALLAETEAAKI